MDEMKEMNGQQKPKRSINILKITASVLSVLAVLLVLAAFGIGYLLWFSGGLRDSMFSSENKAWSPQEQNTLADADWVDEEGNAYNYRDDVISFLLMGIDYMDRAEILWEEGMESHGGNADMLGLVILDTNTFEFSILYIPRDTMVDVIAMDADGNYIDMVRDNICTAHSHGDGKALSCQLTADAVSRLLMGAPVNRYAALHCDAIYTLNEILGGVRITFEIDCSEFDDSFAKGNTVTLNNLDLRNLLTYRDYDDLNGSDVRGMRIMNVLKAMFNQLKGTLMEDPAVALEIVSKLSDYLTTDLELSEITYLARNIGKMDFSSDTIVRLQGEMVMGEAYAEFHADPEWIHDFVVERFCVPAE